MIAPDGRLISEAEAEKMRTMYEKFPFQNNLQGPYPPHMHPYGYQGHPGYHGQHPYNYHGGYHPYQHHHQNNYFWQYGAHAAVSPTHPLYQYYNGYQKDMNTSNLDASTMSPERGSPNTSMRVKAAHVSRPSSPRKSGKKANPTPPPQVAKHPRASVAIDAVDPVYHHLDPISVSLQERVKFGGHLTSVTKKPYHKIPYYFILSEKDACDHISKRAILSREIENEENRDLGKKATHIKKELIDKKALDRDYDEAL